MPEGESTRFADGELLYPDPGIDSRCDVFLSSPTCAPVNDHLMELLINGGRLPQRLPPPDQPAVIALITAMPAPTAKPLGRESITANWWPILLADLGGGRRVLAHWNLQMSSQDPG